MDVAVLLSTYNGERYLKKQIDSILAQRLPNDMQLKLYIRDDGSSDSTRELLKGYFSAYQNVIPSNGGGGGQNIGCLKSFMALLREALNNGASFYAFADQDDVWLPDKLSRGIERIRKSKNPKGALYYSNKTFTDERLTGLRAESIIFYNDYIELLWRSQASGCTMVFNRMLAEKVCSYIPTVPKCLHDAWVYRTAKIIGADIEFDSESQILYRIHSGNTCGLDGLKYYGDKSYLLKNFILKIVHKREHFLQNTVKEIVKALPDDVDEKSKNYTEAVINYNTHGKYKAKLLFAKEMRSRPFKMRAIWYYRVLFNMI